MGTDGDARQQVDVKRTGDDADANPTSSQVLGNLAGKGIRNGANDSFTPNAVLSGQDAIQQYLQSGLLQIKGDPKATAQLGALLQNKDGATLTYQDQSGKLSLTVAGQAKVQAVFNTLKLTETFDVKNFPDQQTAQIVTLVVAVVLTVCTGGAAAGTLGAFLTTAGTASAAMINAAVIAMASTMVGQMAGGASFGQAFEAGIKAGATSALMAGVSFGVSDALGLNAQYDAAGNVMKDTQGNVIYQTANGADYAKLTALQKLGDSNWWTQAGANAAASGVVAEINGGNFTQGFTGGMLGSLSASGAGVIGEQTQGNALANISAHAVLGCASAAASGKDCGSGALGGAASASLARIIDGAMKGSDLSDTTKRAVIAGASVLGSVAIAGAVGKETLTAGNTAVNEVLNNYLSHAEAKALEDAKERRQQCPDQACVSAVDQEIKKWQDLDRSRNTELANACQNPSSSACLGELAKVKIAAASYVGQSSGLDRFGTIERERAESKTLADQYSTRVNNAGAYNAVQGAAKAVVGSAAGVAELGVQAARAGTGDSEAIQQLSNIAKSAAEFFAHPIDNTQAAIQTTLARADALELAGKVDEAQRLRAELITNGTLTVTGLATLAAKAGGGFFKVGNGVGSAGKVSGIVGDATPPVTSGGVANSATAPGLKNQLAMENIASIAAYDSRLEAAVNRSGNFSIGMGTKAEADALGKVWVGDGARPVRNQVDCPGCLISADETRIYRPPQPKVSPFATTGVQANFVQQTPAGRVVSNGHLNVMP